MSDAKITLDDEQFQKLVEALRPSLAYATPEAPSDEDLCRGLAIDVLQAIRHAYWRPDNRPMFAALRDKLNEICGQHI